jgi:delta 1-pyrroline-5-carboxylate dehydrogenase
MQTFADEDEAVELANSTDYGLAGIVYTTSMGRAERVGRAIRAGTVWVNTFLVRDLTAPFGGVGISGIGREGGEYALDFYSDLKTFQTLMRRSGESGLPRGQKLDLHDAIRSRRKPWSSAVSPADRASAAGPAAAARRCLVIDAAAAPRQ